MSARGRAKELFDVDYVWEIYKRPADVVFGRFVMPILERWEQMGVRDLPEYQCGTWGPVESDRLIEPDGRYWRSL